MSNRKQRVVHNGFSSDYSSIDSGAPHGSALGPLLFFINFNDLPAISANELNHDLKVIRLWAYQWEINFNPDLNKQATQLLFSCKKNSPNHPSLFFKESAVPKVKEQKHLGLTLDSKLSFERHINEKIIKAKKGIGIIKYLSKFLPIKTLGQMYKVLARPHLDYCDTIYYMPASNSQINLGVTLNSSSTRPLLMSEINYLHNVDPCIYLITLIHFKK